MDRSELLEVQSEAARAIDAGRRIAERATRVRKQATGGQGRGDVVTGDVVTGADLGQLIASPAAFWAAACAVRAGDPDAVEAVAAGTRLTAARLAVGDFGAVREALVGQATWLGMLAVELVAKAEGSKAEDSDRLFRLALASQRQAAQTLASAAALSKLEAVQVVE